jgi:uncharacterized protein YlxW (UPF0749 family)
MFKLKDYIIILFVSFLLGFIIIQQFYLQKKVNNVTQPDNSNSLAIEVSELIKNNQRLKKERDKTTDQLSKLNDSATNTKKASEAIQEDLQTYKIILGTTKVTGNGVGISINEKVESAQVIDLINAIRNIGFDAISINGSRLSSMPSIKNGVYLPPTTIDVIGDSELLADSLKRAGGIIDQIGVGNVVRKNNIIINPVQ